MWLAILLVRLSNSINKFTSFFSRVFMFLFRKTCVLKLDYPECFKTQYPLAYPIAHKVTSELISELDGKDLSFLAPNVPDLKNYDWKSYLQCSLIRMLKVSELLNQLGPGLKILDIGSYFGNFAIFCSQLGHSVDVVDSYREYNESFGFVLEKFKKNGITVHEIADVGYDLNGLVKNSYDVVLCLSVIEHVPHTPRLLMEAINSVLKVNGHLILETPNLAYIYNRQKLKSGCSVYPSLQSQYFTKVPFQGHHREYTIDEIRWILKQNNFTELALETYLYSLYALPYINDIDLFNYAKMQTDMTCRELIITLSKKDASSNLQN